MILDTKFGPGWWSLVVTALASLLTSLGAQAATHRYNITLNEKLSQLDVRLCFDGAAPAALSSGDKSNASYIRAIDLLDSDDAIRPALEHGLIKTASLPAGACIAYNVSLNSAIGEKKAYRVGDSLLVDVRAWLWRPVAMDATDALELYFNLPTDMTMAGPWERQGSRPNGYRLANTPADWSGRVAFGAVRETSVSVPGGSLRLFLVGGYSSRQQSDIKTWVARAAENIVLVHGEFPVPRADVLVVAVGGKPGGGAIPWAEVQRSGRPVAQFFIDENQPLQTFLEDWTPTHELAHMLHPSLEWQFKWVYEGLASYYQNVARARGGQLSETEAWQKLYDGFQRGLRESQQTNWWGQPKFMEMYWRGAAVALMADVALRKRSGNRRSLDTALRDFMRCCATPARTLDGFEFFEKLDKVTETRLFTTLYGRYSRSDDFPDVEPVLAELGITVENGSVRLLHEGPWVALREQMMARCPVQALASCSREDAFHSSLLNTQD